MSSDLDLALRALLGASLTTSSELRALRTAAAREILLSHFEAHKGKRISDLALRLANATTGTVQR